MIASGTGDKAFESDGDVSITETVGGSYGSFPALYDENTGEPVTVDETGEEFPDVATREPTTTQGNTNGGNTLNTTSLFTTAFVAFVVGEIAGDWLGSG